MKNLIIGLLAIGSISAFAAEHVSIFKATPVGGCASLQKELSLKVAEFIKANSVNGRYTAVAVKAEAPNPGCRLLVTLQDSDFELVKKTDATIKTFTKQNRNALLSKLVEEIEHRDGYVLHDAVEMYPDLVKTNYEVESLYIVPKS